LKLALLYQNDKVILKLMRATDLDLRDLLQFEPKGGVLRFGGQRALLLDAVALGLLRRELIEQLGPRGARGVLTRFGYAHGWRTAEALKGAFPWDDEAEWRQAGGRLHTLQGLVVAEAPSQPVDAGRNPVAEARWHDSYEAEQHLLHLGRAEEAVCWTLTGFASGYLSFATGQEVYCVEHRCRGKGDAICAIIGRRREDWGPELETHLPFYGEAYLDDALAQLTSELKRVEERLRKRRHALTRPAPEAADATFMAQSTSMLGLLDLARRVARVQSSVLITGESGVGKERVARLIHDESERTGGPFVAINCGAMPESLLDSELFGHVKGAFTGATQDRPGLFEAANGGTLFLDEIGEVPPPMQVKLLRALQEREVRRVGANEQRKVDVRVLAATNRDLVAEVSAGRFRQDLYYRLRVVELRVPPLRERRDDILPLARTFLAELSERTKRRVTSLTPAAANQLIRYGWPGNVRELENAIERAVVLAKGSRVDVQDLPEEVALAIPHAYAPGEVRSLAEVERDYILSVVRASGGDKAAAASQLRIGVATLYRKLKQYASAPEGASATAKPRSPRRDGTRPTKTR
jgi:two-component system response regulator HydG